MVQCRCIACPRKMELPLADQKKAEAAMLNSGWTQIARRKSGKKGSMTGLCRHCQGRDIR